MNPQVAVILLNYNGVKNLGGLFFESIESALSIDYPRFDTVIVDNGSTDGSSEEVKSRFDGDVILIKLGKNYGYAGGNVFGLRRYASLNGRPDYVVFMNNDFVIRNTCFLKEMIKFMEKREDICIAQGWNYIKGTRKLDSAGGFMDYLMQVKPRYSGLRDSECPQKLSYVSYAHGACFIVKLKTLPEHILRELFCPSLFMFYEESDLALRTWSIGLKTVALPIVVGEHGGSLSAKKFPDLTTYLFLRNSLLVQKRTFKASLMKYCLLKLIKHLLDTPTGIFNDYQGKLLTRAFVDGALGKIRISEPSPYYPLIIIPKEFRFKSIHILPLAVRWRMFRNLSLHYEHRLKTLTITDNDLKKLTTPFLVQLSFDAYDSR